MSPPGSLDEANENVVVELLMDLRAEGHTLVVVTHDSEIGRSLSAVCARSTAESLRQEADGETGRGQATRERSLAPGRDLRHTMRR